MLEAVLALSGLGLLFAVLLAIGSKAFHVEIDPREEEVLWALPGANCGGCGYPGCAGFAAAVISGEAAVDGCPVGGAALAKVLGEIMGQEAPTGNKKIAKVMCRGDREIAPERFKYDGIMTCQAATSVASGFKGCTFGCLGLGDCVEACAFDALKIGEYGLPIVDAEKCVSCGKCVLACPRNLMQMVDETKKVHILCSSHAKGADTRKVCKEGCIACQLCVKNCPVGAISMDNNVAVIDYEKCINCGLCVAKCPMHTIEQEE